MTLCLTGKTHSNLWNSNLKAENDPLLLARQLRRQKDQLRDYQKWQRGTYQFSPISQNFLPEARLCRKRFPQILLSTTSSISLMLDHQHLRSQIEIESLKGFDTHVYSFSSLSNGNSLRKRWNTQRVQRRYWSKTLFWFGKRLIRWEDSKKLMKRDFKMLKNSEIWSFKEYHFQFYKCFDWFSNTKRKRSTMFRQNKTLDWNPVYLLSGSRSLIIESLEGHNSSKL